MSEDFPKKKHVYIIHGYNASPDSHWFPWLKQKLIDSGISTIALAMPSPTHPKIVAWLDSLQEHIQGLDQNTFFVAHSLGGIALLQYLSKVDPRRRIGGLILVSCFSTALKVLPELDEFTKVNFDPKKIIALVSHCTVIASRNDPIVPYTQTEDLARLLQAKCITFERGGHFLASDGFLELPIIYEELQKMFSS